MHAFRQSLLLVCLLSASCAHVAPSEPPPAAHVITAAHSQDEPYPELAQGFHSLAESGFRGAILFRVGDGPTRLFTHGSADCEGAQAITRETRFDMGSITKALTAAAILRLIEHGRVSAETTLSQVFQGVPDDKASITLMQLLEHRSGLPDSLGVDEDYIARAPYLEMAFAAPLAFSPGSDEEYSNVGYSLLGATIELITGRRYEDALRELVLAPAGVPGIGYVTGERAHNACGLSDGARWGSTRDYFAADEPSWHLVGNGGLIATPEELSGWFDSVLGGRVLNTENTARFEQIIHRLDQRSRPLHVASGSNNIFSALYLGWPNERVVMLIMTSDSRFQKERVTPVMYRALNAYLDRLNPPAAAQ